MSDDWAALRNWGKNVERIEPLKGGVANDVWSVKVDGEILVARRGLRSDEDLNWETQLLMFLIRNGMEVPRPIPTKSGELFSQGIVVMSYLVGDQPTSRRDWERVADAVRMLHTLTKGWPQRPGWKGSIELLADDKGTKVDLSKMPEEGVRRCRAAWARLVGRETSVIHGDLNPRNIRITETQVGLIDWDEAHVDVSEIDLVLPFNASGLAANDLEISSQAAAAWQAAVCWDDDYSKEKLASVRAL